MSIGPSVTWPGLPVLVMLADRPVILLGDGEAAAAKRRLLERAGAILVDEAGDPYAVLPEPVEGRPVVENEGRPSTSSGRTEGTSSGQPEKASLGRTEEKTARLAIVAIEDEAAAVAAVARLKARGVLVNAVDRPALCDFTLPAVVDRAPVLVAVATGGVSAGLAAAVRQRLEGLLPATLGRLAEALAAARPGLRERYPDAGERRRVIGAALTGPLDPFDAGSAARVEAVLGREGVSESGAVVAMTLASADPDDLTFRQARALALADRVLHRPDVPAAILARARADATRLACDRPPAQMAAGDIWVDMA